jgi:hypothetical protein
MDNGMGRPTPSAAQLADALFPLLEAHANIHYLLDLYIFDPRRLRELRTSEDEVFEAILKCVRSAKEA